MNRPFAKTAAEDVQQTADAVAKQIAVLQAKLDAFKTEAAKDPRNWGFSGSLRSVESRLEDLIDFLG